MQSNGKNKRDSEPKADAKTEKTSDKRAFLWSGYYDTSDIEEASRRSIDGGLDDDELRERRKKDWLKLLIGIPLFIIFIYLISLLLGRS